ncbi:lysosomal alpha-glucosidase isoform X3 [Agrilus planipennis]|nr:lysosomal alpha-glucosidase isoform X3 [Agrilus planipennis]XP_025831373.1 lysosomal alpha-glucosidase isoform X3 [Agrilus planipennis]
MPWIKNLFVWRLIQGMRQEKAEYYNASICSKDKLENHKKGNNQKICLEESFQMNKIISNKHSDASFYHQQKKMLKSRCCCIFTRVCLVIFVFMVLSLICLLYNPKLISKGCENFMFYLYKNQHILFQQFDEPNTYIFWPFKDIKQKLIAINSSNFNKVRLPPSPDANQCFSIQNNDRFDCFPDGFVNQSKCEQRGCCWQPKPKQTESNIPLNVPYCFYPKNFRSYAYINITHNSFGIIAFLRRVFSSPFPGDVNIIKLTVKYETDTRLHIKITDPLHKRFEPPYPEVPIVDKVTTNPTYKCVIDPTKTGFKVERKLDGSVIFDSQAIENFIFSDQFLQISTRLPSSYIYGLGEHRTHLLLSTDWQRFMFFNHDKIPHENGNLYGSHPFYLVMENTGKSHGVFLLNSNAIEVILQPTPALTLRALGGILDLYFFMGPLPSDVIKQYTEIIGKSIMPPYWGLGFHFCRFGFKTLNETRKVWKRIVEAGIPLDTQWNDLDYMQNRNDFTLDQQNFGELPAFVNELHALGMHYIPIIDPGISGSEKLGSYPPYDIGLKMDIFVKNSSGKPLVGKVWNSGSTVWPDFTLPNTTDYWVLMLRNMHQLFPFDGAWIDMNEPSNFVSGSIYGCPNNDLETPPYVPPIEGGKLNYKTMCMSAQHYAGNHYDIHNIYGLSEAIVTNFALAEITGKRPMIISRSSFPGLGRYSGHWSGDVVSTWYDMKCTIPELLSFSMFGIPLMGADICGFNGNTTSALCNRWMQLGAFYPFSRNHNTDDAIDQDPVALGPQVVESSIKSLKIRYSFLPYLYTLFWIAHTEGSTVATPMFFEFPYDKNTYSLEEQFLWGPALLIVPVLKENELSVSPYLPAGVWYDFYTKKSLFSKGETVNLSAPLDTIPILIRGGYILPQQEPKNTTTASRKTKIQLLAAPNEFGKGVGQLYWDDGDSLSTIEENKYTLINFLLQPGNLKIEPQWWSQESPPNLGKVTVLGLIKPISVVIVNNVHKNFKYNITNQYLEIDQLDESFKSTIIISWL